MIFEKNTTIKLEQDFLEEVKRAFSEGKVLKLLIADEYDNENDMYVGVIKANDKEYILMRNVGRFNEEVRMVKYFPNDDKKLALAFEEHFFDEVYLVRRYEFIDYDLKTEFCDNDFDYSPGDPDYDEEELADYIDEVFLEEL